LSADLLYVAGRREPVPSKQFFRTSLLFPTALSLIQITEAAVAADVFGRNLADGKALAVKLCFRCHATSNDMVRLIDPGRLLRDLAPRWPLENLGEELTEGISVGHPAMPEFEFNSREIEVLLACLNLVKS
jgi:cytochrome c